ncbi:MAG: DNA-protecting protein DprA [Actinobacteria bacterium]|nr:DNA-protecting protein DprA [Actinomycetota bacterium]
MSANRSEASSDRVSRMCLAAVAEPGDPGIAAAVAANGASKVWADLAGASGEGAIAARARRLDPRDLVTRTRAAGLRFLIPGDDDWPARLADLAGCEPIHNLTGDPLGLWVAGRGSLGELTASSIAMVGSRASSAYGDKVAADIAAGLSASGRCVLSGGGYGIDAAAHRGCLSGPTATVAVLAGGADIPYPSGHHPLFERIAERGVLVSELAPGEHPTRIRFLARSRLIAAIARGTVLVEAAARSGACNTVTWANALGRTVMAVPGPVTSCTSLTPHRLIRGGEAVLVTGAADVLDLVGG